MKRLLAILAALLTAAPLPAAPRPDTFVVFVNATYCGPCHAMRPYVVEAKRKHGVVVYEVKGDLYPDWCRRHHIRLYPTLLLVKNNKVVAKREGFARLHEILEFARR